MRGAGLHHWHQVGGDVQRLQQLSVPLVAVHIEQHGARGIADIGGMHPAFGELPDQPTVHGAKGQRAFGRHGAGAGHLVQNPFELGARKVRIHQQAGLGANGLGQAPGTQLGAGGFGPAVLPDDGVVDRLACFAVPHQGGFALVGDS